MNPVWIAVIMVVIFGVGVYIGVTGLVSQFGIDTSGSRAEAVVCAPQAPTATVGRTVTFSYSGLPGGVVYHWASDDGRSELASDGSLRVTYAAPGTKDVSLFWLDGSFWRRIGCSVTVR